MLILQAMMPLFFLTVFLLLIYGLFFQYYHAWWTTVPEQTASAIQGTLKVSVIVPARNEAANIGECLTCILAQDYPKHLLEIIVADDASEDDTPRLVQEMAAAHSCIHYLRIEAGEMSAAPKKQALATAIEQATGELVVTTDADCVMGPRWVSSLVQQYVSTGQVFIAAPVQIRDTRSLLSRFQALDFLTMQGITAAVVYRKVLNMCNGANLAYSKVAFEAVGGFNDIDHIASGDDMLLMQKMAKRFPGAIGYCKSKDAIVVTAPASSWKAFYRQRIRWASKARHYRQPAMFWVLLHVYCTNLALLSLLVMSFRYPLSLMYFVLLCATKFLMEVVFVKPVAQFFRQEKLLPWLLWLQPLHIVYIVVAGLMAQLTGYEWKGRKLK